MLILLRRNAVGYLRVVIFPERTDSSGHVILLQCIIIHCQPADITSAYKPGIQAVQWTGPPSYWGGHKNRQENNKPTSQKLTTVVKNVGLNKRTRGPDLP